MSFNVHGYNRATLNKAKINRIDQKVIVFVVKGKLVDGIQTNDIRFPFQGEVIEVQANCSTVGTTPTIFNVEKVSQSILESGGAWTIVAEDVTIDANEKVNNPSYTLGDLTANKNDYYRINVTSVGDGIEDVTIEVVIKLD